jgi:hypothetical protein
VSQLAHPFLQGSLAVTEKKRRLTHLTLLHFPGDVLPTRTRPNSNGMQAPISLDFQDETHLSLLSGLSLEARSVRCENRSLPTLRSRNLHLSHHPMGRRFGNWHFAENLQLIAATTIARLGHRLRHSQQKFVGLPLTILQFQGG